MGKFNNYVDMLKDDIAVDDEFGIWDVSTAEFKNVTVGEFVSYTAENINLNVGADWAEITNKPTTINGYGITDAYDKSEVDSLVLDKADAVHTHIENEITDLDKYTQTEIETRTVDAGYF